MNCSAYSNNVNFGIDAGSACTLKNCTARYNTASVTASGGIDAGLGSTLIGCVADTNLNTNATNENPRQTPSAGGAGRFFALDYWLS